VTAPLTLSPAAGEDLVCDPAFTGEWAPVFEEMKGAANVPPWCFYIARRGGEPVGSGAFKGPPDEAGWAEIAYITFIPARGQGVATEVAGRLIQVASEAGLKGVRAHTLPEANASTRVLEANGFRMVAEVEDPEDGPVWRWELAL